MQQSEQRSFRHVLCDHIVLVLIIKGDTHVQYNVGVSKAMQHFDFSDELSKGFSVHVLFAEPLDSY